MSAAGDESLASLRARREALLSAIRETERRRAADEEAFRIAARERQLREERGPDSAGAHLLGHLRDLARGLEDAQASRSRALARARAAVQRLHSAEARKHALEAFLARIARAAAGDGS